MPTIRLLDREFKTTQASSPKELSIHLADKETDTYVLFYKKYSTFKQPTYDWAPTMTLPGNGVEKLVPSRDLDENFPDFAFDEPKMISKCATIKKVYRSASGKVHTKHYSCYRLQCPKCYPHVCHSNAMDYYSEQLQPRMQAIYENNKESGKFYHQVWSVDPQWVGLTKDGLEDPALVDHCKERISEGIKAVAKYLIRKYSCRKLNGSMVIDHPWRGKKVCNECGAIVSHDFNICGSHSDESGKTFYCNSRSFKDFQWVKGWHLHMISNFWIDPKKIDAFNEECAQLHVHHSNISGRKRPLYHWSKSDIVNILSYQLSHAKYIPKKNSKVEFWGTLQSKCVEILSKTPTKKVVVDEFGYPYVQHEFNSPSFDVLKIGRSYLELLTMNTVEEKLSCYLWEQGIDYEVRLTPYLKPLLPPPKKSSIPIMMFKPKKHEPETINLLGSFDSLAEGFNKIAYTSAECYAIIVDMYGCWGRD